LRGLQLRGHLCRGKDPSEEIRTGLPGADQKALLISYFENTRFPNQLNLKRRKCFQ
jgi:hypothetical protein